MFKLFIHNPYYAGFIVHCLTQTGYILHTWFNCFVSPHILSTTIKTMAMAHPLPSYGHRTILQRRRGSRALSAPPPPDITRLREMLRPLNPEVVASIRVRIYKQVTMKSFSMM